jgi:predicted MFS family arabinose efflux permease
MTAPRSATVARARVAVTALFFVLGAVLGVWSAHIPLLKAGLALDDAALGLALLAMGVGAVAAMPLAAALVHHVGPARVAPAAGVALAAMLSTAPLAPDLAMLAAAAAAIGIAAGVCDIAMNAQAAQVERALGRPAMSSIHAFFSIGGLVGGAAGAGTIGLGFTAPAGMGLAALALAALAAATSVWLALPGPREPVEGPAFRLPNAAVLGLGALALCSFVCEGALMEWSGVFLRDVAGAPLAIAAGGYAAVSAAMTVGRLFGDRVVGRLGPGRAVQLSGALAVAGLAILIAAPNPWVAYAGLALAGLGLSNVVPVIFSAAGRVPGVAPSAALAMIATVGYGGQLLAPPGIGFLSAGYGLRVGFLVLLAAALLITLGARLTITPPARSPHG